MKVRGFAERRATASYRGQPRSTSLRLILLALFFVFLALLVLAQHFAVRIDLDAPLFPTFIDDGLVVRALFFPANNFSAFGLRLGSFLNCDRNVGAIEGFLFFFFVPLRSHAESKSGAHRCYYD